MPAGVRVLEFDLAAYLPAGSTAIMGIIGPATKGPLNQLGEFTDEGNFVNTHGRPVDRQHAVRAGIRYVQDGNLLKFVRIAGTLLSTAYAVQEKEVGGETIELIRFEAKSAGTWANGQVKVNITENGSPATSINVLVLFQGRVVERFFNLTNSNIETTINEESAYVNVSLHPSAGTTLPDSTLDTTTEVLVPLALQGGDDGAFASTRSEDSSTGGMSAQNSWSYNMAANGTKDFSGSEGRSIAPQTIAIVTSTPAETFSDDGLGNLVGDAGGTGVIDYETGEWSVSFFAIPTTPAVVSYQAGTLEVIGSTDSGTTTYGSTVARPGIHPDSLTIYNPRNDQLEVGDGATAAYSPTVGVDVVPGTVEITTVDVAGNTMTVTDDGAGALVGDVTAPGTINYATGAMAWTFSANVRLNEPILGEFYMFVQDDGVGGLSGDKVVGTINYETGAWTLVHTLTPVGDYEPGLLEAGAIKAVFRHVDVIGIGDTVETDFSGTISELPIKAGSVQVEYAVGTFLTDNGFGLISGAGGSGTVDYLTGEVEVSLSGAPAGGFPIQVYSDPIKLHFTSVYAGPIGNERSTLTNGIFVWVDKDPNTPASLGGGAQWYRVRVMFNDGGGMDAIETFDALTTVDKLISTINDSTNGSDYVRVEDTGHPGELNIAYDGGNGQKLGMNGAFSNDDVIGAHVGPIYTGMQLFSDPEAVPVHFLTAPGMWHRQIQLAGIELCESKGRNAVWLFSMPDLDDPYEARDFVNGEYNAATPGGIAVPKIHIPYPPLAAIDSSYAFCTFPWLLNYDQYLDEEVWEPGEGDIMNIIGRTDRQYEAWFPIAGIRRGGLQITSAVRYSPNENERAAITGLSGTTLNVVNPFVRFIGQGIYLYGQRTMTRTAQATDRLHVRWTANLIANSLIFQGRTYVFELNDEILWREIRSDVERILSPIAAKRGISEYRVVCDATTNTPEVISQKKVVVKLFIKFAEAAEEIEFQMIFTPTTASFDEVAPLG